MAAVKDWTVDDVAAFLDRLELDSLIPAFKENAVDGKDLVGLSDDDLKEYLGAKPLQIRKIRKSLEAPAAAAAPAAPPAAPPATTARQPEAPPAGYPPVAYNAPPPAAAPAPEVDKNAKLQADIAGLESAAQGMREQAEEVGKKLAVCGQTAGLLKQAAGKLEGGLKALKGVQATGMVDMMHDRRVGAVAARHGATFGQMRVMQHNPGATMLEMGMVRKANEATQSAGIDVEQAKRLMPDMPGISQASVQSAKGGVFISALSPGTVGHIAQMAAVKKGSSEVEDMLRGIGQALQWVGAQQQGLERQAQELRTNAAAKQAEADACKRML